MKRMKKSIFYISILTISTLLTSCFKEIDIEPKEKSTETIITSNYSIYSNVTFFKIYENITAEVSNQARGQWDLAFQSAFEGEIVLLNYTVEASSIKTGTSNFSEVDSNLALQLLELDEWNFNDPAYSNNADSTALRDWESQEVYLVNRGSKTSSQEAYYKIQFISKTSDSYTFKYAHISSSVENEITINRTQGLANVYFSLALGEVVEHEPLLDEWDFYFAPYFGWFETLTVGEFSPYNLTGVMINNEGGVRVCQIFNGEIAYEDIDIIMAESLTYIDWKGVIGSTWKNIPNPDNPVYTMDTNKKYVLKLADGNYYKLRFLDFYSPHGDQGYPSFEINLIK